jgi:hypothetical protein
VGCDVQEAQKLHAEVVWRIDRLAAELADAQGDVAQLSAQARSSGSPRTVGDVDADMEALENQRTGLEREKDTAMRKLERLRSPPPLQALFANIFHIAQLFKPLVRAHFSFQPVMQICASWDLSQCLWYALEHLQDCAP